MGMMNRHMGRKARSPPRNPDGLFDFIYGFRNGRDPEKVLITLIRSRGGSVGGESILKSFIAHRGPSVCFLVQEGYYVYDAKLLYRHSGVVDSNRFIRGVTAVLYLYSTNHSRHLRSGG